MSKKYDLVGKRFGNLTVIQKSAKQTKHRDVFWDCICDCGCSKIATSYDLLHKKTSHCGCLTAAHISERTKKSGHEPAKLYRTWQNMKTRCYNPNYSLFHRYGGRGISVCDEWVHDFVAFRKWAFANGYAEGLTLDRIDNNGAYSPVNCRFTTAIEQSNNRSTNRYIDIFDERLTLAQASRKYGVKQGTLRACVARGESAESTIRRLGKYDHNN